MPLPLIPPGWSGLTVAAKALLKTPAGQAAVKRGSKAITRFLKREDPKSFAASDAQKAAGQKLQKTMKGRRRNEKIRAAGAAGVTGAVVGRETKKGVREDFRDMKATAAKEEEQRTKAAAAKKRRQKISREAATLLNGGGLIKSRRDGIARKGKTKA
tara:strand:- start:237 stop:707 length:471 start_codon:yes stop_codon:yes gene_type:complete